MILQTKPGETKMSSTRTTQDTYANINNIYTINDIYQLCTESTAQLTNDAIDFIREILMHDAINHPALKNYFPNNADHEEFIKTKTHSECIMLGYKLGGDLQTIHILKEQGLINLAQANKGKACIILIATAQANVSNFEEKSQYSSNFVTNLEILLNLNSQSSNSFRVFATELAKFFSDHSDSDFFDKTPSERLDILLSILISQENAFLNHLLTDNNLAELFLIKSVANHSDLVNELKQTSLGCLFSQNIEQKNDQPSSEMRLDRNIMVSVLGLFQPLRQLQTSDMCMTSLMGNYQLDEKLFHDLRCPLTLSLIQGEVVKVKKSNGDYQYYCKVSLEASADMSGKIKNPLSPNVFLTQNDLIPATDEYRNDLLKIVTEALGSQMSDDIKKQILTALKWDVQSTLKLNT